VTSLIKHTGSALLVAELDRQIVGSLIVRFARNL